MADSSFYLYAQHVSMYFTSGVVSIQSITVENVNIQNKETNSYTGGAIYAENSDSFTLTSSTFTHLNNAAIGGAMYLINSQSINGSSIDYVKYSISNSTFTGNSAYLGGAIYAFNLRTTSIHNCTFDSNQAIYSDDVLDAGKAGAIAFSSTADTLEFNITGCTFKNNSAEVSGGALYWDYTEINGFEEWTFDNNSSGRYGDDKACFAQHLQKISQSQYEDGGKRTLNEAEVEGTTSLTLDEFKSGGTLPDTYIALVDKFGQIVGDDDESSATLNINSFGLSSSYTPILSGTTTLTASNGMFYFSGVSFTAEPNSNINLHFSTTGISEDKPSNKEYIKLNNKTESTLDLSINLRSCIVGEAFLITGECKEWEAGSEYSLTQLDTEGNWESWPTDEAICNGGADIGPKAGYWRSSNTTDNFIECLFKSAWLGMIAPDYSPTGTWASGYQGILWADCQADYSRTGDYQWAKCPDPVWNSIRLVLVMLAAIVVVFFVIRSTLEGALVRKNLQSVYMKILMNHLQLILLTSSFNFDWPDNVTDFYDSTKPASQVSSQVLSFDWFLDKRSSNEDSNTIRLYWQKMLMMASLPLVFAVCCFLFWKLVYWKRPNKSKLNGRITASVIILFFLVHPSIVQYMFNSFNCKDIDGEERMLYDLDTKCWTGEHFMFCMFVSVPSLVIWGFGIPTMSWLILYRNKADLEDVDLREKYGFLYNGYKKTYFYWESVIMYRKIAVIFISVFLGTYGIITQALVVFLVLILFLFLDIKLKPFAFEVLNDMEVLSVVTSIMTIY